MMASRLFAGAALAAAVALAPAVAVAHDDDRPRKHAPHRHRHHDRDHGDRHGHRHGDRHAYGGVHYHGSGYDFGRHALHRARAPFWCGPCGHGFVDRVSFQSHVHHHHRVPWILVPNVVIHVPLGWIFHG